jgi:hypothetical protein
VIDLSGINKFYELKWFDGSSVWLKKPTEEMLRKIVALDKDDSKGIEVLDSVKEIVIALVKDNDGGRKFPQEELDQLDAVLCMMILKDYFETATERLGE